MSQIEVITRGSPLAAISMRDQVTVRGMDQIDPEVPLNNLTLGAFAVGADRVEVRGPRLVGAFTRVDDAVILEMVSGRPSALRRLVYEFSGWQER